MKMVVVGSGGRLGAALMRAYRDQFDLIGFDHEMLDLESDKEISDTIGALDFDVLINAAAFTNVDLCETETDRAFRINAEAPKRLAEICRDKKAKLIHFSTDYVFDGEKREPYSETDTAEPISQYGKSKLAGEENVLAGQDRHLVIRVSWVFGPYRPSFIDAMIKRAREEEQVDAIADKISTPTYTHDIARILREAIAEKAVSVSTKADMKLLTNRYSGVLHFSNAGECSWQEYAQHALDCCLSSGIALKAKKVGASKLADMKDWVARRPVYSVLSTAKYTRLTGLSPRSWREAVADYIKRSYSKR